MRSRTAALDAARTLLVERGWDAVTHLAVAERSGIGRSTLYRHWPDAADLLLDVITREIRFSHGQPAGSLREDLINELDGYRHYLTNPWSRGVILTVITRAATDPTYERLRQHINAEGSRAAVEILRRARDRGELPPTSELPDGEAIASLAGPLVYGALVAGETSSREFVERFVDDFLTTHQMSPQEGG